MVVLAMVGCGQQTRDDSQGLTAAGGQGTGALGEDDDAAADDAEMSGTGHSSEVDDDSAGDDGIKFDAGGGDGMPMPTDCPGPAPGGDATISGQVFAPNGELPIAGAAILISDAPPTGVPDHVYCEACVAIDCDAPHSVSGADGTFELELPSGTHWVSVQKGQFMRAFEIDVDAGSTALSVELTRLPDHRDPAAGMWMPKIALGWGEYDRLENGLAKLGLAEVSDGATFMPGTEAFDIWSNDGSAQPNSLGTFAELVSDPELMAQYHIIFVPCSSSPHEGVLNDPQIRANIQDWVAQGGKWYVSDWSLAFLEQPFPQYQTWWEDDWSGGPLLDAFDTDGEVNDDDLLAWLDALPPELKDINPLNGGGSSHPTVNHLPTIELVDLWSTIKDTPSVLVEDDDGALVDVGHKTWIKGPGGGLDGAPSNQDWPLTVTGEYGCGRLMFSSYHTVESVDAYRGLTPQELVLMYLIMEIGVCQVPHALPPEG